MSWRTLTTSPSCNSASAPRFTCSSSFPRSYLRLEGPTFCIFIYGLFPGFSYDSERRNTLSNVNGRDRATAYHVLRRIFTDLKDHMVARYLFVVYGEGTVLSTKHIIASWFQQFRFCAKFFQSVRTRTPVSVCSLVMLRSPVSPSKGPISVHMMTSDVNQLS